MQEKKDYFRPIRTRFGIPSNGVIYAFIALVIVCFGIGLYMRKQKSFIVQTDSLQTDVAEVQPEDIIAADEDKDKEDEDPSSSPQAHIYVHVDGAVADPGLVYMEGQDIRVADCIDKAGGLLDEACLVSVNLAAVVEDGQKIYIPFEGEDDIGVNALDTPSASSAPSQDKDKKVNINTASAQELISLPGIGPATAEAIVEEREKGAFTTCEDLMRTAGIGPGKYEKLEGKICV